MATAACLAGSHLYDVYLGTPGSVIDETSAPMTNHVSSRHLVAADGDIEEGEYVRIKSDEGSGGLLRKVVGVPIDGRGFWLKNESGLYCAAELERIGQLKDKNSFVIEEGMTVEFVDGSYVRSGEIVSFMSFEEAPDVYEAKVRIATDRTMFWPVEKMEIIGFDCDDVMIRDRSVVKVAAKRELHAGRDGKVVGFVMQNGRQKVRVQFSDSEVHVYAGHQLWVKQKNMMMFMW